MCADFLENNYDRVSFILCVLIVNLNNSHTALTYVINVHQVFTEYEKLLHSDNYVTKRQSLKVMAQDQDQVCIFKMSSLSLFVC